MGETRTEPTDVMAAERAIKRRLQEYCRGIDRCDEELVASVYFADATDDHGAFKGLGVDFARHVVRALRSRMEATQHLIAEPLIDFVDATTAHVETYVHAVHRCSDADGPYLERFGGRYIDRFECRNSDWRIADRLVVRVWDVLERITPAFPAGKFTEGRRDRTDPAYAADLSGA
jgi:SnoaL-like domain